MEINITGKLISSKRKELGLTQKELAEKLNVSNRAVSKWETGEGLPDITILPELSKALEISIDELLTGVAPEPEIIEVKEEAPQETPETGKKARGKFLIAEIIAFALAFASNSIGIVTELRLFYTRPFFAFIEIYLLVLSVLIFVVSFTIFFTALVKYIMDSEKILSGVLIETLVFSLFSIIMPVFTILRFAHYYSLVFFYVFLFSAVIVAEIYSIFMIKKIKKTKKDEKEDN